MNILILFQEYDTDNYSFDDYPKFDSEESENDDDNYIDDDKSSNYVFDDYPNLNSDYEEEDDEVADDENYNDSDYDEDTYDDDDDEEDDDEEKYISGEDEVYGSSKGTKEIVERKTTPSMLMKGKAMRTTMMSMKMMMMITNQIILPKSRMMKRATSLVQESSLNHTTKDQMRTKKT